MFKMAILVLLVCHVALYYIFYHDTCGHRTVHICDIVKCVSKAKAFVDVFILKTFCLPIARKSQQLFMGWGRYLDFHKHLKHMSGNESARKLS